MRILAVCLLLGVLVACAGKQSARTPVPADPYTALLADMRHGGYVLYLRHAETGTFNEGAVRDLTDCSWQRNLNDHGREQSVNIGKNFRGQGVNFARVEASPFCRTRQTAELAFGKPTINRDLYYHVSQTLPEIDAANGKLKARLGQKPPAGVNVALVGHAPTMREAAQVELPEGHGALVKPNGDGTFRVVARVSAAGITPQ